MQVSIECQVDASAAANRTVRGVAGKGEGKPITDELESNYDWACWTSLNLPFALGLFTETERHLQRRKHFDIPRMAKALSAEESSLASPLSNMKRVCLHNKQSQVRLKKFPVDGESWVEGQRSSNDVDGAADSAGRSLGQPEAR